MTPVNVAFLLKRGRAALEPPSLVLKEGGLYLGSVPDAGTSDP
jgi:hypothetical protein